MKLSRLALLTLSLLSWSVSNAGTDEAAAVLGLPAEVGAAMRGIDPGHIGAHVKFLADDLLEGRGTGTRGGDIAAQYIASQFASYGLTPAGDDGTYLQKVAFTGVKTLPASVAALVPASGAPIPLQLGEDYVTSNQTQTDSVDIDAPVVFAGFGIEAPEYRWNDFKGIDVKGKVVLLIVNEPPSSDPKFFKAETMTYYGRWTYKFEEAARKGAVAVLIIHRTDLASYGWDVVRSSWSNEQVYLANDTDPKLQAASWIQLEVARRLFAAAKLNLDDMIASAGKRGFKGRELPIRFKAHIVSDVRKFQSYNVLGLLPGVDSGAVQTGAVQTGAVQTGAVPTGASQAIVYSAHYDHLGMDTAMSGDNIYNGAVDNGTGCGILLELARAFTAAPRPPHDVLFASVTAEEKGLLGSNYLGKHPPIPAAQIALDLNYDAVAPLGMPESVNVTGAERTSFSSMVVKTAAAFGYQIQPDPEPGAGHYYRSDHFSMARAGVPAFSINTGVKFAGHPPEWGKAQREEYTAKHYHRPSDEYSPAMDFSTDSELAKFGFALGWQVLLGKDKGSWLPGDEFEAVRAHARANVAGQ